MQSDVNPWDHAFQVERFPLDRTGRMKLRKVNLNGLDRALDRAMVANVPLHLVGEPGVGKTAMVNAYGARVGVPVYPLELAQCDPSDVGGIPVNVGGSIQRLPIGPIRLASDNPGILFLDEWSQAIAPIQGAALTLLNERRAGDFRLHPATRIVLASNPPRSGANVQDLTPPAINRVISIEVRPEIGEVQAYLSKLGTDGSTLRMLGVDYAATMEMSPNLVQLEVPPSAVNRTWASPRAIVNGLKAFATCLDAGDSDMDPVANAFLAGAISPEVADAWLGIRAVRDRMASRADILADPERAKLPDGIDAGIASLGVIAQVAEEDSACAWIFADRLDPETRAACGKTLLSRAIGPTNKRKALAERARAKIMGSTGAILGRVGL